MGDRAVAGAVSFAADHADRVRTLFDTKAVGWPAKYAPGGRLTGRLTQLAAAVRELAAAGSEVLDLGCGSGDLARHLAVGGYRMTGCDIAPAMLHQAAEADRERAVRWIRLEPRWQALPLAADSLDVVIASSVLEYVREPGMVLAECARVLRPGGVLLCTVPNVAHPVRWLEWPLRVAAQTPLAAIALAALFALPATARSAPRRSEQYFTYLRTSCQWRHVRWWHAAGQRAGLEPVSARLSPGEPLSLLIFAAPADTAGRWHDALEGQ
jgi:ubiquinone/menaquinone biosynthesis C-methylase UbiE